MDRIFESFSQFLNEKKELKTKDGVMEFLADYLDDVKGFEKKIQTYNEDGKKVINQIQYINKSKSPQTVTIIVSYNNNYDEAKGISIEVINIYKHESTRWESDADDIDPKKILDQIGKKFKFKNKTFETITARREEYWDERYFYEI